ncbi:hypothetical protein BTJ40_14210 [Microbulbifer sp. A4B17]|nr:hypothetical protein BTJ40_14210 [Microbulbifer sp. A4B17]
MVIDALDFAHKVLEQMPGPDEQRRTYDQLSSKPRSSFQDVGLLLTEWRCWKATLEGQLSQLDRVDCRLKNSESLSSLNEGLYRELTWRSEGVRAFTECQISFVDIEIDILKDWLLDWQKNEHIEISKRGVRAAETGVEVAKEGVKVAEEGMEVAAESTKAAQKSAAAAEASAEIARTGAAHTKVGVWVAAVSASIAALALSWQIWSQNKDLSVNLNSPVALQPVALSDESISNLTHAFAVELSKAKGEQVTLSPESIEGLRVVLRLELERDAHIEVVETKENVKQKAN